MYIMYMKLSKVKLNKMMTTIHTWLKYECKNGNQMVGNHTVHAGIVFICLPETLYACVVCGFDDTTVHRARVHKFNFAYVWMHFTCGTLILQHLYTCKYTYTHIHSIHKGLQNDQFFNQIFKQRQHSFDQHPMTFNRKTNRYMNCFFFLLKKLRYWIKGEMKSAEIIACSRYSGESAHYRCTLHVYTMYAYNTQRKSSNKCRTIIYIYYI